MSASSPIPEAVRRDLERMAGPLAERMLPPKVTQSATTRNVVAAVNDDGTVDVMMGGAVMQRVPATTACVGVAVGDEVIVERYGPRLYCVGVVAKTLDNAAYVRQLWAGTPMYMQAGQVAQLSEPVSAQRTGIVLHWQAYVDGEVKNYDHNYFLVPRTHPSGAGVSAFLSVSTGSTVATKYVYVSDDRVTGNDVNAADPSTGASGIRLTPKRWVLTEVLGV